MTRNEQGGSGRILGAVRSADGTGVVWLQDRYDTDIADLWAAITEPPRLARWLGEVDGDLSLGGRFTAHFFTSGWQGVGRVEACDPPYHWLVQTTDDDSDGADEHAIEATLTSDGDHTVLVIEERGIAVDQLAAYGAGNQMHLEDLAEHLTGRERTDRPQRWAELLPAYQELAAGVG